MANHLRDLIETCESGEILMPAEAAPSWHEFAPEYIQRQGKNAICFNAGHIDSMVGLRVIKEIARLPFDPCWIEFETEEFLVGALLIEDGGNTGGHIWTRSKDAREWMFRCAFRCAAEKNQTQFQAVKHQDTVDQLGEIVTAFRCFLSALNCTNVYRVEHKPDAKLQKARAKRGKQPLFSYWTLELDLDGHSNSESCGGTHAAPRLHLRRGHARQYAPGKYTWVQPCVVGNKSSGIVHKDYALAP